MARAPPTHARRRSQVLGSHNAYHQAPPQALIAVSGGAASPLQSWQYTQPSLTQQLDAGERRLLPARAQQLHSPPTRHQPPPPLNPPPPGVRALELDVNWDPQGGLYAQAAGLKLVGELRHHSLPCSGARTPPPVAPTRSFHPPNPPYTLTPRWDRTAGCPTPSSGSLGSRCSTSQTLTFAAAAPSSPTACGRSARGAVRAGGRGGLAGCCARRVERRSRCQAPSPTLHAPPPPSGANPGHLPLQIYLEMKQPGELTKALGDSLVSFLESALAGSTTPGPTKCAVVPRWQCSSGWRR